MRRAACCHLTVTFRADRRERLGGLSPAARRLQDGGRRSAVGVVGEVVQVGLVANVALCPEVHYLSGFVNIAVRVGDDRSGTRRTIGRRASLCLSTCCGPAMSQFGDVTYPGELRLERFSSSQSPEGPTTPRGAGSGRRRRAVHALARRARPPSPRPSPAAAGVAGEGRRRLTPLVRGTVRVARNWRCRRVAVVGRSARDAFTVNVQVPAAPTDGSEAGPVRRTRRLDRSPQRLISCRPNPCNVYSDRRPRRVPPVTSRHRGGGRERRTRPMFDDRSIAVSDGDLGRPPPCPPVARSRCAARTVLLVRDLSSLCPRTGRNRAIRDSTRRHWQGPKTGL